MNDEKLQRSERFDERGLAPKTRTTYEERAERLSLPDTKDEETLSRFRAYLAERFQNAPLGTSLPERAVAWHHLVAVLGIDENAAKKWLPKLRKVDSTARPAPTDAQWTALVSALTDTPLGQRPLGRRALLLIAETGLRASEACSLRWSQVQKDVGGGFLLVFEGKGGKKRTVPVSGETENMLKALPRRGDFVFSTDGARGIHTNTIRKELTRIGKMDGDLKGLKPHTLRHWFGTDAMENGMDLLALQALMGHKSADTTKRYAEPSTKRLRESMEKLNRARQQK